jgi:uncharacterized protein YbjT (DUF2867 family)
MILVVGGTGQLGGRVVRDLREQGQQVRCLVRVGSDDAKLREQGVELATGDLVDTESLRAACSGVQTVVATASAIGSRLAGARHPSIREADEVGMSALVSAAEDAGVERFVYVSYAGADVVGGSTLERAKATPLSRAKLAVERRLAASSMRSVIARPDSTCLARRPAWGCACWHAPTTPSPQSSAPASSKTWSKPIGTTSPSANAASPRTPPPTTSANKPTRRGDGPATG